METTMAITLTEPAAERVQTYLKRRGGGIGLRLGVRKTGCSGFSYVIDYADKVGEKDVVFDTGGVKIIVDSDALIILDGTEVDFVKDGVNEAFKFHNPNVSDECGCGESFSV